jgi:hypothetical protein
MKKDLNEIEKYNKKYDLKKIIIYENSYIK